MEEKFTGGYEDLIRLIMRLEQRMLAATGHKLPVKPPWKRLLLEFPLNLLAVGYATILKALPPKVAERFFLKMFDIITNNKYQSVGISISESSDNAYNLYCFIKSNYSEPSLWTLTSHPPVLGEIRDLNLGLMGAGYRLMDKIHGAGRPFRIMLAVDVMALDTLQLSEEAIYAGAMGAYHVSTDRLPSSRNVLQKLMMGGTSYDSAGWRLFDALRSRHNVVMIHAGGVGETTRMIYTIRELVWRLRQKTQKKPWEVFGELKHLERRFISFLTHYGVGGNYWKRIEAFLVAVLARDPMAGEFPRGTSVPCSTGQLADEDKVTLRNLMTAFGIPEGEQAALAKDFEIEFLRITPYRFRMFRQVLRHVVRNGVPILILPLDYSLEPTVPIIQKDPVALVPGPGNQVDAVVLHDGRPQKRENIGESFFIDWSNSSFKS